MPDVVIIAPMPRSVNRTRGEHWNRTRRRKRSHEVELVTLLLAAELPEPVPGDYVHASARLVHPSARRRDEGNFRAGLEKALGDALSPHADDALHRWLSDDTPEHFSFGAITFAVEPGAPARCELRLEWGPLAPRPATFVVITEELHRHDTAQLEQLAAQLDRRKAATS